MRIQIQESNPFFNLFFMHPKELLLRLNNQTLGTSLTIREVDNNYLDLLEKAVTELSLLELQEEEYNYSYSLVIEPLSEEIKRKTVTYEVNNDVISLKELSFDLQKSVLSQILDIFNAGAVLDKAPFVIQPEFSDTSQFYDKEEKKVLLGSFRSLINKSLLARGETILPLSYAYIGVNAHECFRAWGVELRSVSLQNRLKESFSGEHQILHKIGGIVDLSTQGRADSDKYLDIGKLFDNVLTDVARTYSNADKVFEEYGLHWQYVPLSL